MALKTKEQVKMAVWSNKQIVLTPFKGTTVTVRTKNADHAWDIIQALEPYEGDLDDLSQGYVPDMLMRCTQALLWAYKHDPDAVAEWLDMVSEIG